MTNLEEYNLKIPVIPFQICLERLYHRSKVRKSRLLSVIFFCSVSTMIKCTKMILKPFFLYALIEDMFPGSFEHILKNNKIN